MNRVESEVSGTVVSRRSFLDICLEGMLAVFAIMTGYAFLRFLWPTKAAIEEPGAGALTLALNSIPIGGARLERYMGRPIIIVRPGEENVSVVSAVCPHLGCVVKWDEGRAQLLCPCHAAVFDVRGNVVSGPSPTALPAIEARVREGEIIIGEA